MANMVRWPLSQAAIGSRQSASACEKPPLFCTRVGVARASRFCSKSSDVEGHQGGPAPGELVAPRREPERAVHGLFFSRNGFASGRSASSYFLVSLRAPSFSSAGLPVPPATFAALPEPAAGAAACSLVSGFAMAGRHRSCSCAGSDGSGASQAARQFHLSVYAYTVAEAPLRCQVHSSPARPSLASATLLAGGCSARAAPSPTHIFAASSSRGFSSLPLLDAAVDASTSASSSGLTSDSLSRFLTQCVNQLLPGAASSAALSLSRFALPALSQTETGVFLSFATRCRGGDDLARSSVSMAISAVGPSVCLGGQEARVHARGERRAEDESGAQELCEKLFSSQIFRVGEDATSCRPAVRLWRAVPGRCALKGSGVAAPTTGDVPDGAGEGTRFLKQSPVFEEASHLVGRQKNVQETGRWAAGAAAEPVRVFSVETLKDLIGKWWIQLWKGNRWKGPQRNKWKWYHRHGYWATRKKLIDFTKYRRYGYHERRGLGKPRMQFWENPSHHKRLKKAIRFW